MSTQQIQKHTRGNTERSTMARLIKQSMGVSASLYQKMWVNETQFGWSVTLKQPHHLLDLTVIAQRLQKNNSFVDYHVATQKNDGTANIKFYSKKLYQSVPANSGLIPADGVVENNVRATSRPGTSKRTTYKNLVQNIVQLRPTQYANHDAYTRGGDWVVVYYHVSNVNLDSVADRMDKSIFADSYVIEQGEKKFYIVLLGENSTAGAKVSSPVSATPVVSTPVVATVSESTVIPPVVSTSGIDYDGLTQSLIAAISSGAMSYESFASHAVAVYELLGKDLTLNEASIALLQSLGKKVSLSIN